jgi:hypothetical protein
MVGVKQKDKGKEPARGARKKTKAHKVPPVYNLTNDDMDRINYQVRNVTEEFIEEATRKQEEQH